MTVKELAGVFDGSTILYIQNEYEKTANDNLCVLSHDGTG